MQITMIFDVPNETYDRIQNQDMHGSDIHDELMDTIRDNFFDWQEDVYLTQLTPPGELEKALFNYIEWLNTCVNKKLVDMPKPLNNELVKLLERTRKATRERLKR